MSGAPYEKSDVNIRAIVLFTIALGVATALGMWLAAWMFGAFGEREDRLDSAIPPATRVPVERPAHPPEPVIQGAPGSKFQLQHPQIEMEAWAATEEESLGSFGWVDRNAGTVHIPIEQAKRMLLERGLPVRGDETSGMSDATGAVDETGAFRPADAADAGGTTGTTDTADPESRR